MSSTPASLFAVSFTSLSLGRASDAIALLVPPAPAVNAASNLKARSFDFLADLLIQHAANYNCSELIAAFDHIPSSSYNAALEAGDISRSIKSACFFIASLAPLGFRDHLGAPISDDITDDIVQCPAGIAYFAFRSTINPVDIDPRLVSYPSFSFDFWLALPQTTCPSSATDTAAAVTPGVTRVLNYTTPSKAASSTTVITAADLLALSNKARAKLATASTTNTLSNYGPACFSIFSPEQVQALVLRSAAASAAAVATPDCLTPYVYRSCLFCFLHLFVFQSPQFLGVRRRFLPNLSKPCPFTCHCLSPSSRWHFRGLHLPHCDYQQVCRSLQVPSFCLDFLLRLCWYFGPRQLGFLSFPLLLTPAVALPRSSWHSTSAC
jgi:hypothetical protein